MFFGVGNLKTRKMAGAISNLLLALGKYHPIVIEGMGGYDPRDPRKVASLVTSQLQSRWESTASASTMDHAKPKLVIIQGDPLEERGISAITPLVANHLGIQRGLVLLDEHIADYHAENADYNNVILQFKYTDMVDVLPQQEFQKLEQTIDRMLQEKNQKRKQLGKPPLKDYYRDFALLQEVTKAACKEICGEISIAHTAEELSEFSVTSFYTAGLELGLLHSDDYVAYRDPDQEQGSDKLDFEKLERVRFGDSTGTGSTATVTTSNSTSCSSDASS